MQKSICWLLCVLLTEAISATVVAPDDNDESEISKYTEEELLARVFGGNRRQKDVMMEFNIKLDGEDIGQALVVAGSEKRIFAKHLKTVLSGYLLPEEVKRINGLEDKSGFVSFEKLKLLNIGTKFNLETLDIEITVPVEKKKIRGLGNSQEENQSKPNVKPAFVSAMLGTRISHTSDYGKRSSDKKTNVILNPAINVGGIVLEGEWTFDKYSKGKSKFYRNYSSLVYDFTNQDATIRAGDVFSGSQSYYSVPRLWGVGFSRNAKSSSASTYGESLQITVLRESKMEIYVNGALLRTKEHIAPGTYYIDDIPYMHGSNDIKIKLIDNTGKTQLIDAGGFLDSSIVAPGDFSLNFGAGYPEINDFKKKTRYDKDNMTISAGIRYGLPAATDVLIGGVRTKTGHTGTAELRNSNPLGFFKFAYGFSRYDKIPNGRVYKISYSSPSIKIFERTSLSFNASYERMDDFFFSYLGKSISIKNLKNYNRFVLSQGLSLKQLRNYNGKNITNSYRVYLNNLFTVNFSFNYESRRHQFAPTEKHHSFSMSKSILVNNDTFHSFNTYFSYDKINDSSGKSHKYYSVSCSLNFRNDGMLSVGYSEFDNRHSTYISYSNNCLDKALYYNVQYNRYRELSDFSGSATYYHQRFKADASYGRSTSGRNSTQIGFETNLYFADGDFGVSKNSSYDGGFIIVSPKGELKNHPIKIAGSGDESGVLGGAVVTSMRHKITSDVIDVKSFPDNVEIKDTSIISYGEYKRGATLGVSVDGTYIAKGILLDRKNKPFAMAAGYAVYIGDKNVEPVSFFSNSSGKFVLSNLRLGKYRICINIEGCEDFYIEVKPCKDNIVDLGRIKCEGTYEDI